MQLFSSLHLFIIASARPRTKMTLKRSYDDTVRDSVTLSLRNPNNSSLKDSSPSRSQQPSNSINAAGKQRRLSFLDDNGECASASTSSRPRALPSTSRARFVPGLQTFVGGLQMSQESSIPRQAEMHARPIVPPVTRRSFDAPDAIQPLMMSRSADAERRASQSAARRRSQEALEAIVRRSLLDGEQPQLVPGVSPGWHVEAHGRQAMELQEGIRFRDEDGWTPLEAFPASTRQGKLAVRRAKARCQQHLKCQQQARQDLVSVASTSTSLPPVPVKGVSANLSFTDGLSTSRSSSTDVEMKEDSSEPRSVPLPDRAMKTNIQQKFTSSASSSASSSTASSSSPSTSYTTAVLARSEEDLVTQRLEHMTCVQCHPQTQPTLKAAYALSDFEIMETLGTGTFGRVLLVRLKDGDIHDRSAYFALKVLAKTDVVRLKQVSHLNSERSILTKVDHPFLVNMVASFQDSKNCYMLMEYVVGGEIFSYLRRVGQFSADVARFYISTIVLAIEYLHKNKIVYRDLKPENLLIDLNGYTKITDFGFAKELEDRTWTLCGTPEYLAPEIIQCSGHGFAVDWWSLGILLFEMLAGYPPFYDPNPILIYEKILAGNLVFPEQIDPVSRDLISSLLTADRSR